jgi:hypothetical protein
MDVCSLVGGSVTKQKNGRADGMMGCLSCGIPTRATTHLSYGESHAKTGDGQVKGFKGWHRHGTAM